MSMTTAQAAELGKIIASARRRHGLSLRALAEEAGVTKAWLGFLEQGRYTDPAPDRLARLAEVLAISPARIDRLTKGALSQGLPAPRAYFRAKYDLTPDQVAKVERYVERLRKAA